MMPRAKIFMILAIVVMVSFACGKSTPKPTSTPAIDTAATAAAQVAAQKATAKAQSALDDKATADAKAAADAKATADAVNAKATADKAAADTKATNDAKAALDAKATADAQAALDAKATADAQAALDAKATADAKNAAATATQAAKVAAQQATQAAAAAQATQAAQAVLSLVGDELTKLGMSTDKGSLGWLQTDSVTIDNTTPMMINTKKFGDNLVASDFVIKTDITWHAEGGIVICGFVYRSEANIITGKQYQFQFLRLSGLPGWDIEYWKDGGYSANITGKIKFASAIKIDNDAKNKFLFAAEGNKFTVFINDQRIGSFYDYSNSRMDGGFAFQGWEEAGTSSCTFANTWVWLLK